MPSRQLTLTVKPVIIIVCETTGVRSVEFHGGDCMGHQRQDPGAGPVCLPDTEGGILWPPPARVCGRCTPPDPTFQGVQNRRLQRPPYSQGKLSPPPVIVLSAPILYSSLWSTAALRDIHKSAVQDLNIHATYLSVVDIFA